MNGRQRAAWVAGAVVAGLAGLWLGVPPLVKWQAQKQLSALLGRPVTIERVAFNPFGLDLTVEGLRIGSAAPEPLLTLPRVHADFSAASLWRRAPVLDALEIDAPRLRLTRTAPGRYDVDDLLARLAPQPGAPPAEPARFALFNLRVRDAQIRFDDRPAGRVHEVDALQLTLPFVSNLPAQAETAVEPRLAFRLNGTPFDTGAQATPFATTRRGTLKIRFDGLDLAPYLPYLPPDLPVRPTQARLSSDLDITFARPAGGPPTLSLKGSVAASDVAVTGADGRPLAAWRTLRLGLRDVQPLAHRIDLDTLRIEGARVQLERDAAGRLPGLPATAPAAAVVPAATSASTPTSPPASAPAATPAAVPWHLSLPALELADAQVQWRDASVAPAAALQLDIATLDARQIAWPMTAPAPLSLAATLKPAGAAGAGARLAAEGSASDRAATLKLTLADLALESLAPYVATALVPRIEGRLAAQAQLDWQAGPAQPRLTLALPTATLDALRLTRGREAATLAKLSLADVQADLLGRTLAVGSAVLHQPSIALARDAQGRLNVAGWLKTPTARAAAPAAPARRTGRPVLRLEAASPASPASPALASDAPAAPWRVQLAQLKLDGGRLHFSDATLPPRAGGAPWQVDVSAIALGLQHFAWAGDAAVPPATLQLTARVGDGTLAWQGDVGLAPLLARGTLRAERLPVHLFAAYAADALPVSLLHAEAGWRGPLLLRGGARGVTVEAHGDARLGDVHVTAKPGAGGATGDEEELLSWQSLALDGLAFTMAPAARPRLAIDGATLTDFYSRLVVSEQGRFNLQEVAAGAPEPAASQAAPPPAAAPNAASAPEAAAASTGLPLDLSIGGVDLVNGKIDFSDHFVRPNYSAALTELNGHLGAFDSTNREMATLELRGRAEGTAQLDIRGKINPGVKPLALDIRAKATDLELPPLSPYAGKYAGYAIERGKLTMDVSYRIDADGRLEAKNQVVLNQLTFGERIDSPSATKLPVLLAVALLKDRNGVIDINLPVSGSINDPQFSIFGIVLKIIGNLLVKALTSPFALLAGGGHDDLSVVEFEPGRAVLAPGAESAIDKVAKALADRPALKIAIAGSADAAAEAAAFQAAAVDARLVAERRREALRAGTPAAAASAPPPPPLTADERTRLLKQVYANTALPDKPRNLIGLAKDLSPAEMQARLAAVVPAGADAMRELALQRAVAVRDALLARGLASERVFLESPRLHTAGDRKDDGAWTPRAQLTLSLK